MLRALPSVIGKAFEPLFTDKTDAIFGPRSSVNLSAVLCQETHIAVVAALVQDSTPLGLLELESCFCR
jgi:hypothetical protein